jgi:hypothetical protein
MRLVLLSLPLLGVGASAWTASRHESAHLAARTSNVTLDDILEAYEEATDCDGCQAWKPAPIPRLTQLLTQVLVYAQARAVGGGRWGRGLRERCYRFLRGRPGT